MTKEIRQRQVGNFYKVDPELARRVAEGIGVEVPKDQEVNLTGNYLNDEHAEKVRTGQSAKVSPALSMETNKVETAKTRKVAILVEDGFAYEEVMRLKEALTAVGAQSEIVSMMLGKRKSNSGNELEVDKSHLTSGSVLYDAVYIPEGEQSIQSMLQKGEALHFVNEAFKHCKAIATSGNGIQLFEKAFVLGVGFSDKDSKKVVSNKGVVTAGIEANAEEFFGSFIDAIKKHRHWDRQEKVMVPA
jgi:catalase